MQIDQVRSAMFLRRGIVPEDFAEEEIFSSSVGSRVRVER